VAAQHVSNSKCKSIVHKALSQLHQTCKKLETASNNQTVAAVAQHIEQRIE